MELRDGRMHREGERLEVRRWGQRVGQGRLDVCIEEFARWRATVEPDPEKTVRDGDRLWFGE